MAFGEKNLTAAALEASRCVYTSDSIPDYNLAPLVKDETVAGSTQQMYPVAIAGKFAVGGSGIYTTFTDTHPDLAAVLPPSDIEDCAYAGQYLLDNGDMLMDIVDPEDVEDFVGSQGILARNNLKLKLLAGIQVMFDEEANELVPLLVYNRALGGVTFYKREKLAAALSEQNRTSAELLEAAEPADRTKCSIFLSPDSVVVEKMAEVAARLLLMGDKIAYA